MAIPKVTEYTGVIPDRRTQSAEDFTSAAVTWTDYQASTLVPSTNAAIDGINATQDEILASVNNAEESSFIAQAAANYQGSWFSGAQVVKGESWSHNGLMWAANVDGAGEPQENAQWFLLNSEPELSAIKVMLEQWGYRYVGLFDDGFTYSQVGDAGVDNNNDAWVYTGDGAPNKVVTAGAVPSVGEGYEQVAFNSASDVTDSRGTNVQDYIDGNLTPFKTVADMKSTAYLSTLPEFTRVDWQGYHAQSDGGSNWGVLRFGTHTEDGGSIFSIDANTYIEANLKGKVSALKFGVKRSPSYDENTIATFESSEEVKKAQAWCALNSFNLKFPAGHYYYSGMIDLGSYALEGDGFGQTLIHLHPDGSRGYCIGNETTSIYQGTCALRGIEFVCDDWDNPCFGAWFSRTIQIKNVRIRHFAHTGAIASHDATQNGPYYSKIDTLICDRNGEHGFVLGAGANALTIKNLICRWNGTQTIGQANPPAGDYDGFYSTGNGDDRIQLAIPYYSPESLSMSGGDCSYNSRYGWNIGDLQTSNDVNLGYTELNKGPKQIRIGGSTRACNINARHGSTIDLETNETNANLYPNRITTVSGYVGTGFTKSGSIKPIDNQSGYDVKISSGSDAVINLVKDSTGRIKYTGSGSSPRITYDSTIESVFSGNTAFSGATDFTGTVETTAFDIVGKTINFPGGTNTAISTTVSELGNISYTKTGSSGGVFFDGVDIHLKSPDGTFFKLTVDNSGNLVTV